MPAVAGHWRGGGVGIAGEKARHRGGLEGWPGRGRTGGGECFRGEPSGGGRLFGRWWLAAQEGGG